MNERNNDVSRLFAKASTICKPPMVPLPSNSRTPGIAAPGPRTAPAKLGTLWGVTRRRQSLSRQMPEEVGFESSNFQLGDEPIRM